MMRKWFLLSGIIVSVILLVIPVSSEYMNSSTSPQGIDLVPADQAVPDGTTLGAIKYWQFTNATGRITGHTVDATDTINMRVNDVVILSIKGKCGGSSGKGMMGLKQDTASYILQGKVITPGVWTTMKVNMPLSWTSPGDRYFEVRVISPKGGMDSRTIHFAVAP